MECIWGIALGSLQQFNQNQQLLITREGTVEKQKNIFSRIVHSFAIAMLKGSTGAHRDPVRADRNPGECYFRNIIFFICTKSPERSL